MDMARSIFGRDHEGYVGREEHTVTIKLNCIDCLSSNIEIVFVFFFVIDFLRTLPTAQIADLVLGR